MFGRNPKLPIDIVLEKDNNEGYRSHLKYVEQWKNRMKEAFQIASANTDKRRMSDKRYKDRKATLQPLEVGGRVLVRNLGERGGPGKTEHSGSKRYIKF